MNATLSPPEASHDRGVGFNSLSDVQIAIGLALPFVFATRLLAVSDFDVSLALALLRYSDKAQALIGIAVTATPILAATTVGWCVAVALLRRRQHWQWIPYCVFGGGLGLLVASRRPVLVFVLLGLGTAMFFERRSRDKLHEVSIDKLRQVLRTVTKLWLLIGMIVAGPLGVSSTPWLPLEIVSSEGGLYEIGYVLRETDDALEILHRTPRIITTVDRDDVRRRVICGEPGASDRPVLGFRSRFRPEPDLCHAPLVRLTLNARNTAVLPVHWGGTSDADPVPVRIGDRVQLLYALWNTGLARLSADIVLELTPGLDEIQDRTQQSPPTRAVNVEPGLFGSLPGPLLRVVAGDVGTTMKVRACYKPRSTSIEVDIDRCGETTLELVERLPN